MIEYRKDCTGRICGKLFFIASRILPLQSRWNWKEYRQIRSLSAQVKLEQHSNAEPIYKCFTMCSLDEISCLFSLCCCRHVNIAEGRWLCFGKFVGTIFMFFSVEFVCLCRFLSIRVWENDIQRYFPATDDRLMKIADSVKLLSETGCVIVCMYID